MCPVEAVIELAEIDRNSRKERDDRNEMQLTSIDYIGPTMPRCYWPRGHTYFDRKIIVCVIVSFDRLLDRRVLTICSLSLSLCVSLVPCFDHGRH